MHKIIAIIASLDTKGAEVCFIKEKIERLGCRTLIIDVGVLRCAGDLPRRATRDGRGSRRPDWATIATSQKHERIAAMVRSASRGH